MKNSGYCGEVSLQAANLKYGAYYSQYDIRATSVESPIRVQTGPHHFYSIGKNDQLAVKKFRLNNVEFDHGEPMGKPTHDVRKYLAWLKQMVRKGYAVTMTVLMNHCEFYANCDEPDAGCVGYDHIVSLAKVESNYDDDEYHDDDIVTFSDHGLWSPRRATPYYFSYTFKEVQGNRQQANAKGGPIYMINNEPKVGNYGNAQTGIVDRDGDCLPILIETNLNYEDPQIGIKSEVRPEAMPLTLTVTVSGLQAGVSYKLYKYNDESLIPEAHFNEHARAHAISAVDITAKEGQTDYRFEERIMSNQKVIYRAVRADAK